MFTGIVETVGVIKKIEPNGSNINLTIESKIGSELKIDQSISHNGICLTVVGTNTDLHTVTAVQETLEKSNLKLLKNGGRINLERCMKANGRFDGHIVQGHVDQTGTCTGIEKKDGSWLVGFEYDAARGNMTVEKGSICINGVSLTCFNSTENQFTVVIIPFTMENTTFKDLKIGNIVNLEFDIIGKYVSKLLNKN